MPAVPTNIEPARSLTIFAAAVAAELDEFGLSHAKIEEIMRNSAKRFGEESDWAPEVNTRRVTNAEPDQSDAAHEASVLGWIYQAASGAYDAFASSVAKHAPGMFDRLSPMVVEALENAIMTAINNYLNGRAAMAPRPTSRRR